jgi:cardiolipin synthase
VAERAEFDLALDRAAGARLIPGNTLEHHPDSAAALEEMLRRIAAAERWIHLENYIIRNDHTGRRFAEALAERAGAGVKVRVLYDALGSFGTSHGYWSRLVGAGVDVRAFHPILSLRPFQIFSRDHRKLLLVDGGRAMIGGLCIGDEWAGDAPRGRQPWRDTMLTVCGPAAAVLDRAFGRIWARAGSPLPAEELAAEAAPCGSSTVRVVVGIPGQARIYRVVQLLAAVAAERLWITDAYLVAPPTLFASLLDAARGGVDVRLLVPGTSDLPVLRTFTRAGYRELLAAGVRIFEWQGPMLHAKTLLADRAWARVGSSNLNVSSLLTNYELDVVAECDDLATGLANQFRRDMSYAREIVMQPRRIRRPALVGTAAPDASEAPPAAAHKRSRRELGTVAVVAFGRVLGGVRRTIAGTAALTFTVIGGLLLIFPTVMSVVLAAGAFWLAAGLLLYGLQKRRARETMSERDDGG